MEEITLLILTIICTIFFVYSVFANKKCANIDSFTLYDKNLDSGKFSTTFTASCLSLATVVVFFLSTHHVYGILLLVAPLTFITGQLIFCFIAKKYDINPNQYRTIADFIYYALPIKGVARLVALINLTSFLIISFMELYIGTVVLLTILPNCKSYNIISFLGLGGLVALYVKFGGYRAIVKTDIWQLIIAAMSVFAIVLFAVHLPAKHSVTKEVLQSTFFPSVFTASAAIIFVAQMTFNNLMVPFTNLSFWQRLAATKSTSATWKGILKASWINQILSIAPIIGFLILMAKGYHVQDVQELLTLFQTTPGIMSSVILSIVIIGFTCMVISSVDVSLMACIHSILDNNTLLYRVKHLSKQQQSNYISCISIFLFIALAILYYSMNYTSIGKYLVALTYLAFGQMTMLCPITIYALYKIYKKQSVKLVNIQKNLIFAALLLSWMIALVSVEISVSYNNYTIMQAAVILAASINALALWIAIGLHLNIIRKRSGIIIDNSI